MNYQSGVPVSVSVSGISQQSQPAMPTPGTVPAPVPQAIPPQFGSGSSGSSGAGQFGSGTVSGPAAQSGASGSQFVLSNSAAIRGEIHRFESVHPNIYSIYDLVERIDDLALQNQIREHVISIEVTSLFFDSSGLLLTFVRCSASLPVDGSRRMGVLWQNQLELKGQSVTLGTSL
ncbi:Arf-GAP with GTPase, ANK repeat and PH domain-containing protein 3 [Triplophysa tibetana]|uniref:Arf-GAP with GTPase, ANK repeat and PH domain-containing protein 3 n=1 Tax=Triplophysa tibetana TaxID=1572043 RepID=A0A5A9N573_9TELE|nr:Arf-GAP with GTPase, ANK repeat and PH domain-containing protein 3 [Triplophysa tibetana]